MARGPARSEPLTWHVALWLPWTGRDDVEYLGRLAVTAGVGLLCDATAASRVGLHGTGVLFLVVLLLLFLLLHGLDILTLQS